MKIKKVQTWKEDLKLTRPYTIAYETIDSVENIFVLLEAENGVIGIGAASPAEDVTGESIKACEEALANKLEPILHNKDIRYFQSFQNALNTAMVDTPAARAAADIALHDLVSSVIGLPLVDLLGRVHDTMATSITIGIKPVDETLEEAGEYWERGFRILKVKTGLDVDEDSERLIRLREKFGMEVILRVDANQGYTQADYKRFLNRTKGTSLEFVEQPLNASDLDGMRSLDKGICRQSAADECLLDPQSALKCLSSPQPFGIFNIKLMKCGGISPGLEIARMAHHAGIDLMWGCMDESIVSIAAALHAAFASPATKYLDLDGSLDLARDLVTGGFIMENGWLRTTGKSGLGVKRI
ncbi:dipeptide epimerase [bacterium]|nr:dipeptide epimerase [bacterium]